MFKPFICICIFVLAVQAQAEWAHHRDVEVAEEKDGAHQIATADMDEAERQANHYCDSINGKLEFQGETPKKLKKKMAGVSTKQTIKFKCLKKKTLMDDLFTKEKDVDKEKNKGN